MTPLDHWNAEQCRRSASDHSGDPLSWTSRGSTLTPAAIRWAVFGLVLIGAGASWVLDLIHYS